MLSFNVPDQRVTYHRPVAGVSRSSGSVEFASPGGAYRLVLNGRQATVFRFSDGGVLARAEADIVMPSGAPGTPGAIAWAPDSSALALLTTSGEVLVISLQNGQITTVQSPGSGGLPPVDPAQWALAWSPGSSKLAIMSLTEQGGCKAQVEIVNSAGRALTGSPLSLDCRPGGFPGWATDDVLQVTRQSSQTFYSLPGGQIVVTRHFDPAAQAEDRGVLISPGQRWMAMKDAVDASSNGETVPTLDHTAYSIVDFSSGGISTLSDTPNDDIEWVAWKLDASILYLVSRPAAAGAAADPRTPFGLLAFDPEQGTMRRELDRAVQVSFDPTQTWAFVVLSDPKAGGLVSALWLPAQNRISPAKALSSEPAYAASTADTSGHGQTVTPAAWSHDGRQVAYADDAGDLKVTSLTGQTHTIATGLFLDWNDWNSRATLAWSPDDQRLLINYNGQLWVADLGSGV